MGIQSASAQAIGYYYQISYALYHILLSESDLKHAIQLEGLDDIECLSDERIGELLELKHHHSHRFISNRSIDLWRTLRIWSIHFKQQRIELPGTKLKLVTTAEASEGSIAALLRPDGYPGGTSRNSIKACQELQNIARNPSKNLKQFTDHFNDLSTYEQQVLVDAVEVFDCAPTITEVDSKIKPYLKAAVPIERVNDFFVHVMGSWRNLVISHLKSSDPPTISVIGVMRRIHEMSQDYRPDPLPAYSRDLQIEDLPKSPDPETDSRTFVRQLIRIKIHSELIRKAIYDHYRAYKDRNRWVEDELYWNEKLYFYDKRLKDEWERIFYRHCDRFKRAKGFEVKEAGEQECVNFGQVLYDEISDVNVPINDQTNYNYITRGSYHELADQLRVWWHPKFIEEIKDEKPLRS
jgi:hypothetical protein